MDGNSNIANIFSLLSARNNTLCENPTIISGQICSHSRISTEHNIEICDDCGEEVRTFLDIEHPNENMLLRVPVTRTIQERLVDMGIPANVREKTEMIYNNTTGGKNQRGDFRDGLILASVFEAYKQLGHDNITMRSLRDKADLKKSRSHVGRKLVMLRAPKEDRGTMSSYTSPVSLVEDMLSHWKMDTFSLEKCIDEIMIIFQKVEEKSDLSERSRPSSVAAGMVYYYMLLNSKPIKLGEFSTKVGLSETIIKKNATAISKVLKTPQIISY
jgi:transcription initiation factor TFIIIB Brf1 subunit/transcription initiation factor TFIIB